MRALFFLLLVLGAVGCGMPEEGEMLLGPPSAQEQCTSDCVEINCSKERESSYGHGVVHVCSVSLDHADYAGGFSIVAKAEHELSLPAAFQEANVGAGISYGSPNPAFLPTFPELADDSHLLPYETTFQGCGFTGLTSWANNTSYSSSLGHIYPSDFSFGLGQAEIDVLQITLDEQNIGSEAKMIVGGMNADGEFWSANLEFGIEDGSRSVASLEKIDMGIIDFDLDDDGVVGLNDILDFNLLMGSADASADFDGSGLVDCFDLLLLRQAIDSTP